jgi:ligand-binding sensor domain-containing protein
MRTVLAHFAYKMINRSSRRPLLLRSRRPRTAIAATLAACLTWVLLLPDTARALDPNKRITQYLHTSWRTQDGSAPSGIYTVAQTSDGFLWFSTYSPAIYRFDGIRLLPRHFTYSAAWAIKFSRSLALARWAWAVGSREIAYIKDGQSVATSN